MAKLTADQWADIRAEREAGASFGALAKRHGIGKSAITNRSTREGWGSGQDLGDAIRQRVSEKVSGIVGPVSYDPVKKAAAIDAEAARGAAVVERHRRELAEHAELFQVAEIKENFNIDKSAKISVEMLAIRQKAERTAWGLDDPGPKDITKLSDAELEAMVRGR
jgi:hypothetical protein